MNFKCLKFFRSSHFIATLHSKYIFLDSWDNIFLPPLVGVVLLLAKIWRRSSRASEKVNYWRTARHRQEAEAGGRSRRQRQRQEAEAGGRSRRQRQKAEGRRQMQEAEAVMCLGGFSVAIV